MGRESDARGREKHQSAGRRAHHDGKTDDGGTQPARFNLAGGRRKTSGNHALGGRARIGDFVSRRRGAGAAEIGFGGSAGNRANLAGNRRTGADDAVSGHDALHRIFARYDAHQQRESHLYADGNVEYAFGNRRDEGSFQRNRRENQSKSVVESAESPRASEIKNQVISDR